MHRAKWWAGGEGEVGQAQLAASCPTATARRQLLPDVQAQTLTGSQLVRALLSEKFGGAPEGGAGEGR